MIVIKKKPSEWTTFRGKEATPDSIDHQHLSNVYWFGNIITGVRHEWVLDVLKERFNGHLLPYRPHIDFHEEIRMLESRKLIVWETTNSRDLVKVGKIFLEGKEIGEIRRPTFPFPGETSEY